MKAPRGSQRRGERACRPCKPPAAVAEAPERRPCQAASPETLPHRVGVWEPSTVCRWSYMKYVAPRYRGHAGTAEPLRVPPPKAVASLLELCCHLEEEKALCLYRDRRKFSTSCLIVASSVSKFAITACASEPELAWARMAWRRSDVRPSWRKNNRCPTPHSGAVRN